MKKRIALLLALVLCIPTMALADDWAEGRSPSKPYAGVPEVDLSEQIGYMVFHPNEKMVMQGGGRVLHIYLPRADAEAGEGKFYLATDDGEIWRTAFNDTEYVTVRPMTEYETSSLLWGSGTCFEITLPQSLKLGETYFCNLDSGCIVALGGKVENPTIGGTESWRFTVQGDYGVSLMEYRRPVEGEGSGYEEQIMHPQPGDEVRFDVELGGVAAMAVIYANNNSISFDATMIEESGEVVGTVTAEDPSFGLVFLDGQGTELMDIEF